MTPAHALRELKGMQGGIFAILMASSLFALSSPAFGHDMRPVSTCASNLSDQTLTFVGQLNHLRPGERNVFVWNYFQAYRESLSLTSVKQLIEYGLVKEEFMPSHQQHFRYMTRNYVETNIVRDVLEMNYKRWSAREVIWVLELVRDPETRARLRAEFPPEKRDPDLGPASR